MDISSIGVKAAIGAGSAAAVATPATLGVIYKDEISKFMGGSETPKPATPEEDTETKGINNKLKDLGVPEKCNFSKGETSKDCNNLTLEEAKKINFSDKGANEDLSMATPGTFNLKIEKVENKNAFPEGLKFTFSATQEVKMKPKTGNEKPFLKANEKTEFRIKTVESKNSLEKVTVEDTKLTQLNSKIASLGIPNGKCRFAANKAPVECQLSATELKAMKFVGGTEDNTQLDKQIKLKVEKIDGSNFPENLKFTFSSTETSAQEYGNEPNRISVKSGESDEFKIKVVGNENKLEKVWTIAKLGEKIGLSCTVSGNNKNCVHKTGGKINVWKNDNDKIENATGTIDAGKLIFEEDQNSNYGFKLEAKQEITLTVNGSSNKKIDKGNYEIKYQSDKKWYLSRKS